jgi:uncharacterized protein with GYD domain
MPKFLYQGSYTEQGLKGLLKDGGSSRRQVIERLAQDMGGSLEAFYFAFGEDDFVVIVDVPSHVDAAAVALTINATGAVRARTTLLMAPEDIDAATRQTVTYRPPGG